MRGVPNSTAFFLLTIMKQMVAERKLPCHGTQSRCRVIWGLKSVLYPHAPILLVSSKDLSPSRTTVASACVYLHNNCYIKPNLMLPVIYLLSFFFSSIKQIFNLFLGSFLAVFFFHSVITSPSFLQKLRIQWKHWIRECVHHSRLPRGWYHQVERATNNFYWCLSLATEEMWYVRRNQPQRFLSRLSEAEPTSDVLQAGSLLALGCLCSTGFCRSFHPTRSAKRYAEAIHFWDFKEKINK